jgi:hypothetical protein
MSPTNKNTNDALAAISKRLGAGVVVPDTRRSQLIESFAQLAPAINVFLGIIAYAGSSADGQNAVQFNDQSTNTGYASTWPQWAFDLAKAALLSSKRVLIIANGQPFGSNLASVLIYDF